jgi:uncharacterized protein YacL (UPF0231 family)
MIIMRKYNAQIEVLRELFNAPPEKPLVYYSPLLRVIHPWVNNEVRDLLPKQKAGEKDPALKTHGDWVIADAGDWVIANALVTILEYATPSLQIWRTSSIIPSNKLRDNLVESLEYITTFHNEDWEKLFLPIFEDFIKVLKSFKDFDMESLSDFLAANELHDLWLIVATVKDYEDESTEDRFSL